MITDNLKNIAGPLKHFLFGRKGMYKVFYEAGLSQDIQTIFDVGANIGDTTISAVRYFPAATIYCFEPCREAYKKLEKRLAPYKERVKLFNFSFYKDNTETDINVTSFHGANSILNMSDDYKEIHPHIREERKEKISLKRLDDFVVENKINRIDLLKIDVEGVEKEVIEGGKNTLKNIVDNLFIEISFIRKNRSSADYIEIFRRLHEFGFFLMDFYDIGRRTKGHKKEICQVDCYFSKNY